MRSGRVSVGAMRAVAAAATLLVAGSGTGLWLGLGGGSPADRAAAATSAKADAPAVAPVTGKASPAGSAAVSPLSGIGPFRRAWVAVPVATVWNHPDTARPEDATAVSAAPDMGRWVTTLGYQQKLGLDDLLATQALLYQPLFVFGHDRDWDHVVVLGQTGSVFPWGIAGWVPDRQLRYIPPPATAARMTVDVPTLTVGGLTLSYGTELPVAAGSADQMTVVLPSGRFRVAARDLRAGPLPRSGPAVVAQAERFLGLPYLWAGTSSFGYDCSGLTYSVYKRFGVTLARDAADQSRSGIPVGRHDLRAGDLVFFAFDGTVDHVGIYAGNGMMVDAPHTGASIEMVPLFSPSLSPYYAGARRYI